MSEQGFDPSDVLAKRALFMRQFGMTKQAEPGGAAAAAPPAAPPANAPTPSPGFMAPGTALGNAWQTASTLPGWAYPLIGAGSGALLGGLGSLTSRNRRRRWLENSLYGALTGGLLGTAVPIARGAAAATAGLTPSQQRLGGIEQVRSAIRSGNPQQLSQALAAAGLPPALANATQAQQLRALDAAERATQGSGQGGLSGLTDRLQPYVDDPARVWQTHGDQATAVLGGGAAGAAAGDVLGRRLGVGSLRAATQSAAAALPESDLSRIFPKSDANAGVANYITDSAQRQRGAGRLQVSPLWRSWTGSAGARLLPRGGAPLQTTVTPPRVARGSQLPPGVAAAQARLTPEAMRAVTDAAVARVPESAMTAPSRLARRGRRLGGIAGAGLGLYSVLNDPATYGRNPDGTPIDPMYTP